MLSSSLLLTALSAVFAIVLLLGLIRLLGARSTAVRLEILATGLAVLVVVAVMWGWGAGPEKGFLLAVLAAVALWFAARVVLPGRPDSRPVGSGRVAAFYRLVMTGIALWVTVALSGSGGLNHQGILLGTILMNLFVAVVLFLACAGWLLATFAVPEGQGERLRPALGVQEALIAGALGACLLAIA